MSEKLKSIFEYLDYRSYLKDLIEYKQETDPDFTTRGFAKKAGFGSPSYLKMIIDGERKLTDKSFPTFCQALEITGKEKDYFKALVKYTQTKDPDKKHRHFEEMASLRSRKKLTGLNENQLKYLSHHHYVCIREMVLLDDFEYDAKWIAARCLPRISPQEAREAIETLLELGLLKKEGGKITQSECSIATQPETQHIEAIAYHDAVLRKARECLQESSQDERHYDAITVPMSSSLLNRFKEKISEFIDEAFAEAEKNQDQKLDEVYQLNVQFFPVTTKKNLKNPGGES